MSNYLQRKEVLLNIVNLRLVERQLVVKVLVYQLINKESQVIS